DGPASLTITNCTIRSASGNGMTLYAADPRVLNCAFNNNTNFAIYMRSDSLPVLRNNAATGNGKNAIGVFGFNVTRTGMWTRDNLPYTAFDSVVVNNGVTLTLEPGTTFQFQDPDDGLFVDGTLIARGTGASPILFTSDESVKQPGQWQVLFFRSSSSSNSILESCVVECAASALGGFTENIRIDGPASLTITNCTIRSASGNGMTLYAAD